MAYNQQPGNNNHGGFNSGNQQHNNSNNNFYQQESSMSNNGFYQQESSMPINNRAFSPSQPQFNMNNNNQQYQPPTHQHRPSFQRPDSMPSSQRQWTNSAVLSGNANQNNSNHQSPPSSPPPQFGSHLNTANNSPFTNSPIQSMTPPPTFQPPPLQHGNSYPSVLNMGGGGRGPPPSAPPPRLNEGGQQVPPPPPPSMGYGSSPPTPSNNINGSLHSGSLNRNSVHGSMHGSPSNGGHQTRPSVSMNNFPPSSHLQQQQQQQTGPPGPPQGGSMHVQRPSVSIAVVQRNTNLTYTKITSTDFPKCLAYLLNRTMAQDVKACVSILYYYRLSEASQGQPDQMFQTLKESYYKIAEGESLISQVIGALNTIFSKLVFTITDIDSEFTLCDGLLEVLDYLILLDAIKDHKNDFVNDFSLFSRLYSMVKDTFDLNYQKKMDDFLYRMKISVNPSCVPGNEHVWFSNISALAEALDGAAPRTGVEKLIDHVLTVLELQGEGNHAMAVKTIGMPQAQAGGSTDHFEAIVQGLQPHRHLRVLPFLHLLIDKARNAEVQGGKGNDVFAQTKRMARVMKICKQSSNASIPLYDSIATSAVAVLRMLPHWDDKSMLLKWLPNEAESLTSHGEHAGDMFVVSALGGMLNQTVNPFNCQHILFGMVGAARFPPTPISSAFAASRKQAGVGYTRYEPIIFDSITTSIRHVPLEREPNPVSKYWFMRQLYPDLLSWTNIKCVVLGNSQVGKSLMQLAGLRLLNTPQHLWRYASDLPTYMPNVFDIYRTQVTVDGWNTRLSLWDVAGDAKYDRLRPLLLRDASVVAICFSLASSDSLYSLASKWLPVARSVVSPVVPIVVVGLQADVRQISTADAMSMAKQIGAAGYIECSALDADSIRTCYQAIARAGFLYANNAYCKDPVKRNEKCSVM